MPRSAHGAAARVPRPLSGTGLGQGRRGVATTRAGVAVGTRERRAASRRGVQRHGVRLPTPQTVLATEFQLWVVRSEETTGVVPPPQAIGRAAPSQEPPVLALPGVGEARRLAEGRAIDAPYGVSVATGAEVRREAVPLSG